MSEPRAAVFYCPFCAEEDLHPVEQHGGWECRSCLRVFTVKVLGLAPRTAALTGPAELRRQQ
jgi:ribosomal protein L37AE/L43A